MNPAFKIPALVLCLAFTTTGRAQVIGADASGADTGKTDGGSPSTIPPLRNELPGTFPRSDLDPPAPSFRVTFFPPTTPLFGAPIPDSKAASTFNGLPIVTPETLADFVNEYFYSALGTRLIEQSLPKQFVAHLDAYQATRTTLINELKDQLALTEPADPATRERQLRAFSALQTPRIVALEQEAEQLRDDLVRGAILQSAADWNAIRAWKLGALPIKSPAMAASAEFQVVRAAAYFSKGFSAAQRGLLREIAMELREKLQTFRAGRAPAAGTDPLAMFFSPETSRLRLPRNLPPGLSTMIGIYNRDKTELKNELHETVVTQDQVSSGARTKNFEALAEAQRPRLAALADRAEEIRRGLAALPKPPPPAPPPDLPPEVIERINAYRRDKTALDTALNARISQATRTPLLTAGNPDQPMAERVRQASAARTDAMKQAGDEFRQENAERYADLKQRADAIRKSLDGLAANRLDPATGKPMDAGTLMRAYNTAEQQFEKIGREEAIYRDYNLAMLLPGLSSEQRRLLFGAALVGLAQPLPAAERMPTSPAPSMLF